VTPAPHARALLPLAHGVNVTIIAERLGHEDIQTALKQRSHDEGDARDCGRDSDGKA
jgi:hypothetical protein